MRTWLPLGFRRYNLGELTDKLISSVDSLQKNSYNLVISGEADDYIYKDVAPHIIKSHLNKNCKFKFLVGPILLSNSKNENILTELAKDNIIDLYISYCRQQIIGSLFNLGRNYSINPKTHLLRELHYPASDQKERIARDYPSQYGIGLLSIKDFIERFKFLTIRNKEYYPKSTDPEKDFIFLSKKDLKNLLTKIPRSVNFDFMEKEIIESYLQ